MTINEVNVIDKSMQENDIKVYTFMFKPNEIFIQTQNHILSDDDKEKYGAIEYSEDVDKDLVNFAIQNNKLILNTNAQEVAFDINYFLKDALEENGLVYNKELKDKRVIETGGIEDLNL